MQKEVKTFHSKHTISFLHALDGIKAAYKSQPNLKIIFLATLIVMAFSFIFQISRLEWVVIIFICFVVMVAEMANTAMEATVDLITSEWREEAKFAKDVTAGGVLLAVLGSIIVGVVIFIPRIIEFVQIITSQ
ncbi:hypothetical protein A2X44_03735 [candidate division CPR3 bacterium GWF2_35_18]|uniref:Diacylglycerol kinase n=1 Tax=candidate division CPR3 bacterium GW2011_GWF2_35_18 TaxID=1618350 RepID=A0A0G0BJI7_UNCC3|nr:MAG: Diacylglycerol kinase [candidate division CPR3 bacterium GW2011_GWF2_35_18]KKP85476.1 MAG: Diacylglycerol kinase [candidate division CPR3 bacterium GW2011_GWE2_35_7]OGB63123.1 MAG: hypothetical protein A2X44_03735 [candidate division CPR3 bacterium GWF2_35_18]OGB64063.1 MAG: hypothetical protein A2250_04655 [candidate division CPR3 bacterium RIFOXYA2_FULL_35_13]OGB79373.1 MAG: hypothetical protein A2296_04900 [candidate division CPR3 bacterium RIFOXYB2_FULL_35_8]OGB79913.1 MAG: hypothe